MVHINGISGFTNQTHPREVWLVSDVLTEAIEAVQLHISWLVSDVLTEAIEAVWLHISWLVSDVLDEAIEAL